jgi:hypothetical protein
MIIVDAARKRRCTAITPSTSSDEDEDKDEDEGFEAEEEEEAEGGFFCDAEDSGSEDEYRPGSSDESGDSDVSYRFCPIDDPVGVRVLCC